MGPLIILTWLVLLVAGLVLGVFHLIKGGLKAIPLALGSFFGAGFTWWFVSAWIGVKEIDGYSSKPMFFGSLVVGFIGIGLFVYGIRALRKPSRKKKPASESGA